MDFKNLLEAAWNLTLRSIVSLIFLTLVQVAVSLVTFGILAPVTMAGYMQSVLRLVREGRDPRMQDIFDEMPLFLPLLGFGIAVALAVVIGFTFLVLPGLVVALGVSFACIYMLPLMTDRRMGLLEAARESYALAVGGNLADHAVVVAIYIGLMAVGNSVFIGWLFTQPFATVFLLLVYEKRTGGEAGV